MSLNLYTPPASKAIQPVNTAFTYRSLYTLSQVLTILLIIYALVSGASILSYYIELKLLNSATTTAISYQTLESNQLRQALVAIGQLVMLIIVAIPFGMFLAQANRNVRALGAKDLNLEYTPGWMVGWFFIPFANFWKPYDAIKQVWTAASTPHADPFKMPWFFTIWWTTWISQGIVTTISARVFRTDTATTDGLIIANWLDIFSEILAVVCTITAVMVIRAMHLRLEKRLQFVQHNAQQQWDKNLSVQL